MLATYRIPEPFDAAVRLLRDGLARDDLRIPFEIDMAGRIRRELGVGLAPCRLLGVDCPLIALEALTLESPAAALIPLHLLVCGRGPQTVVHVFRPAAALCLETPAVSAAPVTKLQGRVTRVLKKMAMRENLCESID